MSKPFNEPCGGCGETLADRRCLGCMHEMPTRIPPMTETAKLEALKPCPFCGSHNIDPLGWASTDSAGPACDDCGASAGKATQTVEQNVTAWNTRPLPVSRPAVKGLEWKAEDIGCTAQTDLGEWAVDHDDDEDVAGTPWSAWGPQESIGHFSTEEAAKAAAQSDFEQRSLSSLSPPTGGATHRHVKRGSEYEMIGIGKLQAEHWHESEVAYDLENDRVRELKGGSVDMREIAIYRDVDDGSLWARPLEEFRDGRFVALTKKEGQ